MQEKAEQGFWPTVAPLGYRNIVGPDGKKIIEPDPNSGPLISRLFEWYATERLSLKEAAEKARCSANHLNIRVTIGAADCFPHSTDPRTACEQYYLAPAATPYACRETAARKDCFEKSRLRRLLDRSCRLHRELH